MAEFDHKEYARQMRENCAKDQNGNIICSAELWEQIASIIESTADVVPKSEVDRLETEVRLLTENSISAKYPCCVSTSKGLILTKSLEEYDKLLADISSEVAREIFEEIETYLFYHENIPNTVYKTIDKNIFTNIKKKYT